MVYPQKVYMVGGNPRMLDSVPEDLEVIELQPSELAEWPTDQVIFVYQDDVHYVLRAVLEANLKPGTFLPWYGVLLIHKVCHVRTMTGSFPLGNLFYAIAEDAWNCVRALLNNDLLRKHPEIPRRSRRQSPV